jgi:hypothetical protein
MMKINPRFVKKVKEESKRRDIDFFAATDESLYKDETSSKILEILRKIHGESHMRSRRRKPSVRS